MKTAGALRPMAVATTVSAIDVVTLVALRAAPARAWADLTATAPAGTGRTVDAIAAAVASALLVAIAVWVGLALGLTALRAVPGMTGQLAQRCLRMVVPAALRRIAAGAAGLGVFLTPVVANASTPTPAAPAPASVTTMPAPTWPMSTTHPSTTHPSTTHPSTTHPSTTHPAATRPRSAPAITKPPHPRTDEGAEVAVRPGDCLWLIARHRLGPAGTDTRTAALWPEIYRLNRDVIGDDPSVIHPGQQLRLPGRSTEERAR